jgi:hypothetical protein
MHYQLTHDGITVLRHNDDGSVSHIPTVQHNEDYQQYLKFLEDGGQPLPVEEAQQEEPAPESN